LDNCAVIIDTSEDTIDFGVSNSPAIIKTNKKQINSILGTDKEMPIKEKIAMMQKYIGEKQIIVVTLEDYKTLYVKNNYAVMLDCERGKIKNTVGFSDSICACLAYGLANKYSLRETINLATAVSGVIVSDYSEYSFAQQVNEMQKKVTLEEF